MDAEDESIESGKPGRLPTVLVVAATDSAGGAGLAADLRTLGAHGVHGAFAVTAVTAQTTEEIRRLEVLDPDLVAAQLDAVLDDLDVRAIKTGLLASPDVVAVVGERASAPHMVVDPVLVRRTGEPLFGAAMADAYRTDLFPRATVLTPNVAEAALLVGQPLERREEVVEAAEVLHRRHGAEVVVTGWLEPNASIDVHAGAAGTRVLQERRITTSNIHGTGCSLASAIAARLAGGADIAGAVDGAKAFVHRAIEGAAAWRVGSGQGGIDHMGAMTTLRGERP